MNTTELFHNIFNDCSNGYITIWTLPEKKTYWFRAADYLVAGDYATKLGEHTNTFFGLGLRKEKLKDGKRGSSEDISTVVALYADIDVLGPAHKETELPKSKDEAIAFVNSLFIKPSIIVWSGNGLHGYWLLDKPYNIKSQDDRNYITSISEGWGKHISQEALKHDWKLDTVSDLSRVLRVPGTTNHKLKDGAKCEVLSSSDVRHSLEQFEPYKSKNVIIIERETVDNVAVGSASRIFEKCAFMQHCRDNAATLPEPNWHAMVTNISLVKDGSEFIHEISRPYPNYNKGETDEKIRRAIKENKPHTCEYIKHRLGFQGCGECTVKAPVVYCILSKEEQVQQLVNSKIEDMEAVYSDENLALMAFAKKNLPAEYAKFKMKLKNKVSLRDFDNAIKNKLQNREYQIIEDNEIPLELKGIKLFGAVQPANWDITIEKGVRKVMSTKDGTSIVTACPSAVVISKRFENVDNESEKVEISFFRNNRWKRFVAARSAIFNKTSLVAYGDSGLPVSSSTSAELINYLSDYENANIRTIPLLKSTARLGWLSETEFYPYTAVKDVCFETEHKEADEIYQNLKECGSYVQWKETTSIVRKNPFARFLIAASFASPLLEKLNHRVFFVNVWHDSKSGKTAVIKLAVAAWGNPLKIMGSFNATAVGMERRADMLRHIVFGIDERQLVNEKRLSIGQIVYGLSNGFGKIRGNKEGGVQDLTSWRNIILASGEEPLTAEDSHDGINTRVLEIHGHPVLDEEYSKEIHIISEKNYGFAGRIYIEYITNLIKQDKQAIKKDYDRIYEELKKTRKGAKHLENAAVVCLGDYYAEIAIWQSNKESAFEEAVQLGSLMLENNKTHEKEDIILRSWQYINDWCVANDKAFSDDAIVRFGVKESDNTYFVLKFALDDALQKKNYPVEKCKTGFFERGYMPLWSGKRQKQKKLKGVTNWYYVITVSNEYCIGDIVPLTSESVNPK